MLLAFAIVAALVLAVAYAAMADRRRRTPEQRRIQRRYARIPLSVPVEVATPRNQVSSTSHNISVDGMLLVAAASSLRVAEPVELSFVLPEDQSIQIPAVVWRHQGRDAVVRFDPTHGERKSIQRWVAHAERSLQMQAEGSTTGV